MGWAGQGRAGRVECLSGRAVRPPLPLAAPPPVALPKAETKHANDDKMPPLQGIVISLKDVFFEKADALVRGLRTHVCMPTCFRHHRLACVMGGKAGGCSQPNGRLRCTPRPCPTAGWRLPQPGPGMQRHLHL